VVVPVLDGVADVVADAGTPPLAPGVGESGCGALWQATATTTSSAVKRVRLGRLLAKPAMIRFLLGSILDLLVVITV
jgi:hypothetical protein